MFHLCKTGLDRGVPPPSSHMLFFCKRESVFKNKYTMRLVCFFTGNIHSISIKADSLFFSCLENAPMIP